MVLTVEPSVRYVTKTLFERYLKIIDPHDRYFSDPNTHDIGLPLHLAWMCRQAIANINNWPDNRIFRYLGYVQGIMSVRGLISAPTEVLDSERIGT